MKIFVICQVRGAEKEETERQKKHVEFYEGLGHEVYWPPRDTEQVDPTGLLICEASFRGIQQANVIHVLWNHTSEGTKFDLGMAFALGKPIIPFEMALPHRGKSFPAMIQHYFDKYGLVGAQLPRLGELLRSSYQRTEVLPDEPAEGSVTGRATHAEPRAEESALREPFTVIADVTDYLASHGIHSAAEADRYDDPPTITITTDIPVSGGEQEHIKNVAKGYKIVFRRFPEEEKGHSAC